MLFFSTATALCETIVLNDAEQLGQLFYIGLFQSQGAIDRIGLARRGSDYLGEVVDSNAFE